ncbi:D-inositol-3-phosphate glycosyltransferase [ANME-1 cluster archaeon GoMg3.2]|nr:D-inositol-3-phosphate glycosyltransferase [ANME-1 cluster archaeon GoMg3.2]
MNLCIASGSDLSRPSGDTIRVLSLVSGFEKTQNSINLVVPKPSKKHFAINIANNVEIYNIFAKVKKGSLINFAGMCILLILKAKKIRKNTESILQIEFSELGGCFAFAGSSNYILDVQGLTFDEVRYKKKAPFIPLKLYQKSVYYLEKLAIKRASKVIAVSNPMKDFLINKMEVSEDKIIVIPNGYIESIIKKVQNIKENKGMVSFIGSLSGWANVDKIVEGANALKNEDVFFYIVGDGQYRRKLESMVKKYNLRNVTFTGFIATEKAYEIMAKSEILLAPFPKTLALEVACPIKLLEYMALGKAMVVDNVGEIPAMLKRNDAALVSNPLDKNEFTNYIQLLLNDSQLRKKISSNAKMLSKDFTWEKQAKKLVELYETL